MARNLHRLLPRIRMRRMKNSHQHLIHQLFPFLYIPEMHRVRRRILQPPVTRRSVNPIHQCGTPPPRQPHNSNRPYTRRRGNRTNYIIISKSHKLYHHFLPSSFKIKYKQQKSCIAKIQLFYRKNSLYQFYLISKTSTPLFL